MVSGTCLMTTPCGDHTRQFKHRTVVAKHCPLTMRTSALQPDAGSILRNVAGHPHPRGTEEWMRKQILTLLGAGLIGLMHPAAAQATLLDFTFSFTGTVPPGSVAGTVTGEIFGLTEGASSSATNVIVVSYPVGLEPPSPPQTVFSGIVSNAFEVDSSGAVTGA